MVFLEKEFKIKVRDFLSFKGISELKKEIKGLGPLKVEF